MEKVSIEEQKKVMSTVAYTKELEKLQITEDIIDEIRNNLVSHLKALIIPIGQDIVMIQQTISEINGIINDEVWNDIYDDNVTLLFKNYITYTKNYDLKKEQIIKAMAETLIELLGKITDLGIKPKHIPFEDESGLTEEEIKFLKSKATRLILQYKKFKEEGTVKYARVYSLKLYAMAETEAKFEIINNLFFDFTGEYVLDKIRKEKEKQEREEKEKIEQKKQEIAKRKEAEAQAREEETKQIEEQKEPN